MANGDLTKLEMAGLTAFKDSRQSDDYDTEFYQLLLAIAPPDILEMDERIRRAITKYIKEAWEEHLVGCFAEGLDEGCTGRAAMNISFLIGYELGRELQRPLTSNQAARE